MPQGSDLSKIVIGNQTLNIKDAIARGELEQLDDIHETISSSLNELNDRISTLENAPEIEIPVLELSNTYTSASGLNSDLYLEPGDTYEEAFGKLEKTINDNEQITAAALNDLNDKIENSGIQVDWNAVSGTAQILNKPNITNNNGLLQIDNINSNIILSDSGYIQMNTVDENNSQSTAYIGISSFEVDISSSNAPIVISTNSNTLSISNYDDHPLFNENYLAFLDEAFNGVIKLTENNESNINNISDGVYRIQYVWHATENGEQVTDDVITNSGILIQKSTYDIENFDVTDPETYESISTVLSKDQYMYINGIVKHRSFVNTWTSWENLNSNIKPDWNAVSGGDAEILNKPNIRSDQYGVYIGTNSNQFTNSYVGLSDGKNSISLDTGGDHGIQIIADDDNDGQILLEASDEIYLSTTGTNKAYYNNKEIAVKDDIKVTSINGLTGAVSVNELPTATNADNGKILMVVSGVWAFVTPSVLYSGNGIPNNANGNNGDLYMQTN